MADEDPAAQDTADEAAEEEWRFPLSDFDGDDTGDGPGDASSDDEDGAVVPGRSSIEAGDPTLEGTFFLLLGVGVALFVISRLVVG